MPQHYSSLALVRWVGRADLWRSVVIGAVLQQLLHAAGVERGLVIRVGEPVGAQQRVHGSTRHLAAVRCRKRAHQRHLMARTEGMLAPRGQPDGVLSVSLLHHHRRVQEASFTWQR